MMTTRLIELCLTEEQAEESPQSPRMLSVTGRVFVVDPYMINIKDFENRKPGKVCIIRARRPALGSGSLHKYMPHHEKKA